MRAVVWSLAFILFGSTTVAAQESTARVEFRAKVEEYAKVFTDPNRASVCAIWEKHVGSEIKNYTFEVIDNATEYEDAFFIRFYTPGILDFTTLVAYAGYNGHVLGQLKTEENSEYQVFEHSFNGHYVDKVRIETNKVTGGVKLDFFKELKGVLIRSVKCAPTVGI